jgi:hypothetical protein
MTRKARIVHLAGPNATIQNTPPLVTSNMKTTGLARWRPCGRSLCGCKIAVASRQRLRAPGIGGL